MSNNSTRGNLLRMIAVCLTVLFVSSFALSQGIVTGTISGTVLDEQNAVISGAQITAVQNGTNQDHKAVSDSQGFFSIPQLPIGTYTVTITAPNFTTRKVNEVAISAGVTNALGASVLKVGSAGDIVTVEAKAPLIEATSSQISTNFDTKVVAQLPNGGAGFDNLALYIPGVANNGAANFSNSNGAAFASNGLRGRSNNFQIDGQSNNDNSVAGPSIFLSNPDAISELQIVTNNFSAEYGRDSGSVVNYVTKSGTNAFHGSGYDYYTGSLFNTRSNGQKNPLLGFCTDAQVTDPTAKTGVGGCTVSKVPRSNENRFAGNIGGPIWKDHAWFFGSYQGDRLRAGASPSGSSSLTPTPNGITQLVAAFGANNPAVKALQTIGPYAVTAGSPTPTAGSVTTSPVIINGVTTQIETANITRFVPSLFNDRQITGRADMNLSDKDRFFVRYIYQQSINTVASGVISSGAWVDVPAKDQQIGLDYTRTWNSHWVSQARFSFSRAGFGFEQGSFPTCTQANITVCPTGVGVSGFLTFGLANNLPQGRLINTTQYVSNNTYSHGKHTIKFGGEFDRQRSPNVFLPNINGTYTFGATAGGNNAFGNFISGNAQQIALTQGPKSFNFREKDLSFYAQDDWRILDNLTLNLGLRWDWNGQAVNLLSDITVANQALATPLWSAATSTNITELPQIPQALKNYGPNVGFAWTPRFWQSVLGQDKTVVRGGYRIAYDPSYYNIFLNIATSAPVVNSGTILCDSRVVACTAAGAPVVTGATGLALPASGSTGADVATLDLPLIPTGSNPGFRSQTRVTNDFHQPMTQQWSLGIEHQIGAHIGVESRYVGNHVTGNFQTIDANPLVTGLPASVIPAGVTACPTASAAGFGRVDCNFGLERTRNNGAWSIYHGLQNRIDLQNFHGMTAGVEYTWSKGEDNTSEIFSSTGGISTPVAQNPFDPNRGERGISAQSFPHVFTSYWVYELPWQKSQSGIMGHILGGWQWAGQYQWQSGAPITPAEPSSNFSIVNLLGQTATSTVNPLCDPTWAANFIGLDSCRPIAGNPNAPFDSAGAYMTTGTCPGATCVTNFYNISTKAITTPDQVRFIVNNAAADAALCAGSPFNCVIGRNVYRAQNRNNLNLGLQKTVKLTERFNLNLRADMFNVFNRQFFGTPGLNINSNNINGVSVNSSTLAVSPSSSTFGTYLRNGGTNRSMVLLARISF